MIIYDNKGAVLLDIDVDDTSVRYKAINGENSLTLKFSLDEHKEVPLGAFCEFKNETYSLMLPEDLMMRHRRAFEYTLVMYSEDYKAKRYKFVNPADGRLKFSLTAKPKEHLQMYVDNMNARDNGWEVGECPEHVEIVLSYNHTYCHDALVQLANELELDYWFDYTGGRKTVNIGKLELNKDNPLPLSYGGDGEGLKADIKRTNYTEALPIEVLYVQGSSTNINPSKYRVDDRPVNELHLPILHTIGYDGTYFEDEAGYDTSKARQYKTDARGLSVRRADKDVINHSEDSLDCSEITPTKEETIEGVWHVDKEKHFFDIAFKSDVDYSKYQIEGETPTIIFQSGMLAGKEFQIATDEDGTIVLREEQDMWRMEIVPQEIDGITMPDEESGYVPLKDETFKFFGIQLPDEYLAEAEMEMLRYAVKHLYANEDVQYTISGELDEIYAKKNWENIGGRLTLGSYVSFTDKSFQSEPILIRITGIKEYVNKPHSPLLEISNATVSGSIVGSLNRVENQEAYTEKIVSDSRQFTKRSFADAKRAIKLLEDAIGYGFEDSIKPVTVQTMMMLVGDERLQFAFVEEVGSDVRAERNDYFDSETKTFKFEPGVLKHYTLGINEIRSKLDQKYRYWTLPELESAVLDDPAAEYYVYAFVDKEGETGEFGLETEPIDLEVEGEEDDGKYHLLMGLLLSERDGSRDYLPLYGFTQIQPGQITTDVIRSEDGEAYFDLARNEIGGVINFKAGSYGELNIGNQNMLRNSGFTGDYLSEPLADEMVMDAAKELYSDPLDHWTKSGTVNVVSLERAVSGKAVRIEGALSGIAQELYHQMIEGEEYVLSFKAASLSATSDSALQMTFGGVTELVMVGASEKKHVIKIKAAASTKDFSIELFNAVSAVVYDLQLERGTIATAWGNSPFDNNSDRTYYQSLKYLQHALKGTTTQAGGLILSEAIRLGDTSNQTEFVEKAGANGYHIDDNSPAFWAGGSMEDAIDLIDAYKDNPNAELTDEQIAAMAKFAVTHGGRAILNDMILRGYIHALGGKIGDLVIEGNGISVKTSSNGRIVFTSQGLEARQKDGSFTQLGMCGSQAIMVTGKDAIVGQCYNDEDEYKIAAQINAADKGHAIHSLSGLYAGLRPNIRAVYSSATLDALDHTLIVDNDSAITLTLPSSPRTGQEYKLIHRSDKAVTLSNPSGSVILDVSKDYETVGSLAAYSVLTLTYFDGIWYAETK